MKCATSWCHRERERGEANVVNPYCASCRQRLTREAFGSEWVRRGFEKRLPVKSWSPA